MRESEDRLKQKEKKWEKRNLMILLIQDKNDDVPKTINSIKKKRKRKKEADSSVNQLFPLFNLNALGC